MPNGTTHRQILSKSIKGHNTFHTRKQKLLWVSKFKSMHISPPTLQKLWNLFQTHKPQVLAAWIQYPYFTQVTELHWFP